MQQWMAFLSMLVLSIQTFAFSCYYTVAKEDCWKDYDVNVSIIDTVDDKLIAVVKVPKGEAWTRIRFDCQPKQTFKYTATYSPEFWKNQEGKVYLGKKTISLPTEVKPGEAAWHIRLCFSDAFTAVPLPPTANKTCKCDWTKVPELKPEKDK